MMMSEARRWRREITGPDIPRANSNGDGRRRKKAAAKPIPLGCDGIRAAIAPTDENVEVVASAIHLGTAIGGLCDDLWNPWEETPKGYRVFLRKQARAVLKAIAARAGIAQLAPPPTDTPACSPSRKT